MGARRRDGGWRGLWLDGPGLCGRYAWLFGVDQAAHRLRAHAPPAGGVVLALALWGRDAWRYAGLGIPAIVEAFAQPVAPWDFAVKGLFTVFSIGTGFKEASHEQPHAKH